MWRSLQELIEKYTVFMSGAINEATAKIDAYNAANEERLRKNYERELERLAKVAEEKEKARLAKLNEATVSKLTK